MQVFTCSTSRTYKIDFGFPARWNGDHDVCLAVIDLVCWFVYHVCPEADTIAGVLASGRLMQNRCFYCIAL